MVKGNTSPLYFLLFFLVSVVFSSACFSHELSNGYLSIQEQNNNTFSVSLSLQPIDLEQQVMLDANRDGQLTWAETQASQRAIQAFVETSLQFRRNDQPCTMDMQPVQLESISGQTLIRQPAQVKCIDGESLIVAYSGIFDQDRSHKVLVTATLSDNTSSFVLSDETRVANLTGGATPWTETFFNFVYEGIIHIWIGIDHILFLVALLLTVNLLRDDNQWKGQEKKRTVIKQTVYLITAFTLAHSVTLTTTALGWYTPSSRLVELGIAITVLLTALNNIWPLIHRLGWITFGFGLLHGMGFASVFAELQSSANQPLLSIAAFNIGVEIGQLVIVCLLIPLLLVFRHRRWYPKVIMPTASSIIALIAINWAFQRW